MWAPCFGSCLEAAGCTERLAAAIEDIARRARSIADEAALRATWRRPCSVGGVVDYSLLFIRVPCRLAACCHIRPNSRVCSVAPSAFHRAHLLSFLRCVFPAWVAVPKVGKRIDGIFGYLGEFPELGACCLSQLAGGAVGRVLWHVKELADRRRAATGGGASGRRPRR